MEGIPKPPSSIYVEDGEFTPNYDPSPYLTELGPVISKIGNFHDRPTYSRVYSPLTHHRYGMPEDDETHFEPARTSYGSYGMSSFPTHDLAFLVESKFEPNTMPGGHSHSLPCGEVWENKSHCTSHPGDGSYITYSS